MRRSLKPSDKLLYCSHMHSALEFMLSIAWFMLWGFSHLWNFPFPFLCRRESSSYTTRPRCGTTIRSRTSSTFTAAWRRRASRTFRSFTTAIPITSSCSSDEWPTTFSRWTTGTRCAHCKRSESPCPASTVS